MNKIIYSIILVITVLSVMHLLMNFQGANGFHIASVIASIIVIIYSLMKLIE